MIRNFIILFLTFSFIFPAKSNTIIGLDSLNLGNKIEILKVKKSIYTGNKDTIRVYVEYFENLKSDKPDFFIKYSNLPDRYILLSRDSIFQLLFITNEYRQFKSNQFEYANEISELYRIIYKKEAPNTRISRFTKNIKIETKTEILPSKKQIYFSSKLISSENLYTITELTIQTDTFNELEYKFKFFENGKNIEQLESHYVYKKANNTSIFNEFEEIYYNWRNNYKKILNTEPKKDRKKLRKGDTLDLNYILYGLNRDNLNLEDYFKSNKYLIIYTWGTWCGPCISNTKNVIRFNKECRNNNFVTLICEKGKADLNEMRTYVNRKKLSYPVCNNEAFIKKNHFQVYPSMIVLNSRGIVVDAIFGCASDGHYLYEDIISKYGN